MKSDQCIDFKTMYEEPRIDVIQLSCADIMSTSGKTDGNQGEWDPQSISAKF